MEEDPDVSIVDLDLFVQGASRARGRTPRKSIAPRDPAISKEDIAVDARRWLQDNFVWAPEGTVLKTEVYARYGDFVATSQRGGVNSATLGKIICELWEVATVRLGPRNDSHYHFKNMSWKLAVHPPADPVQPPAPPDIDAIVPPPPAIDYGKLL